MDPYQKLNDALLDAYAAVEEKNGVVPEQKNTNNLAEAILTVQPEGGAEYGTVVVKDGEGEKTIALDLDGLLQLSAKANTTETITLGGEEYSKADVLEFDSGDTLNFIPPKMFAIDDNTMWGVEAFKNLRKVRLGDGIKTVPKEFWLGYSSSNITREIEMTAVEEIGMQFMERAGGDIILKLPSTLKKIGEYFLSQCSNFNSPLTLPEGLEEIGPNFMYYCTKFNSTLTLPEGLKTIKYGFMNRCSAFNQPLNIPNSVESIGQQFLYNSTSFNQPITLPNNIQTIGYQFLYNCSAFNQPIEIPNGVKEVGYGFLQNCTAFNSEVTLPNTLTVIPSQFLQGCTSYTQPFTIPDSVTTVNGYFLYNCNNFVGPLNVGANSVPVNDNYSLGTTSSSALMYTTGVTMEGDNTPAWESVLKDRSSSPYRKLKYPLGPVTKVITLTAISGGTAYVTNKWNGRVLVNDTILDQKGNQSVTITVQPGDTIEISGNQKVLSQWGMEDEWDYGSGYLMEVSTGLVCSKDGALFELDVPDMRPFLTDGQETAGNYFWAYMNNQGYFNGGYAKGAVAKISDRSFDTSMITSFGYSPFYMFNGDGPLTGLPSKGFDFHNVTKGSIPSIMSYLNSYWGTRGDMEEGNRGCQIYLPNGASNVLVGDQNSIPAGGTLYVHATDLEDNSEYGTVVFDVNGEEQRFYATAETLQALTRNDSGETVSVEGGASYPKADLVEYDSGEKLATIPEWFLTVGSEEAMEGRGYNKLRKVHLGRSITDIPDGFIASGCPLEDLTFGKIKTIGNYFLLHCNGFNQPMKLPNTVTSIGDDFLGGIVEYNSQVTLSTSLTSIGDSFMYACGAFNQPITIPSSVTAIGDAFFQGCHSFNQPLTLPSNLQSIGTMFLCQADSFAQKLTIPASVKSVGDMFMYQADSFTQLEVLTSAHPSDDNSLAASNTNKPMFTEGVTMTGAPRQAWVDALPNNRTRNLKSAVPYISWYTTASGDTVAGEVLDEDTAKLYFSSTTNTYQFPTTVTKIVLNEKIKTFSSNPTVRASWPRQYSNANAYRLDSLETIEGLENITWLTSTPSYFLSGLNSFDPNGDGVFEILPTLTTATNGCYSELPKMKKLILGDKLKTITNGAFYFNSNLEEVEVNYTGTPTYQDYTYNAFYYPFCLEYASAAAYANGVQVSGPGAEALYNAFKQDRAGYRTYRNLKFTYPIMDAAFEFTCVTGGTAIVSNVFWSDMQVQIPNGETRNVTYSGTAYTTSFSVAPGDVVRVGHRDGSALLDWHDNYGSGEGMIGSTDTATFSLTKTNMEKLLTPEGAIPDYAFSRIASPGRDWYGTHNAALVQIAEGTFDLSSVTSVGKCVFAGFNNNGKLTSLPAGFAVLPEGITSVGDDFCYRFNCGGTLEDLGEGSFHFPSSLTKVGASFLGYFNMNGALAKVPAGSFNLDNISEAGYSFMSSFNIGGKLSEGDKGVEVYCPVKAESIEVWPNVKAVEAGGSFFLNVAGEPYTPDFTAFKAALADGTAAEKYPVGTFIPDSLGGYITPLIVVQYLTPENNEVYGGAEGAILMRSAAYSNNQGAIDRFGTTSEYKTSAARTFVEGDIAKAASPELSAVISPITFQTQNETLSAKWFIPSITELYGSSSDYKEGFAWDYFKEATGWSSPSGNSTPAREFGNWDGGTNFTYSYTRSQYSNSTTSVGAVTRAGGSINGISVSNRASVLSACFISKN